MLPNPAQPLCSCATGIETAPAGITGPIGTENPPGRSRLRYRLGTHGSFKESMINAAAATASLARHTGSDPSSPLTAWIDTTAYLLDNLTFYNEVILNEGYLTTASERLSLLELARSIGYELKPGAAASTYLAFDTATAPGLPDIIPITPGIQAQDIPTGGELPRIFETIESIDALPAWSSFQAKPTRPQAWVSGKQDLTVQGTGFNLPIGSRLLLLYAPLASNSWSIAEIASVQEDYARGVTVYALAQPLTLPAGPLASGYPKAYRFSSEARAFGSNAPDWRSMPSSSKRAVLGLEDDDTIPPEYLNEWPNFVIHLPATYSSRFDSIQVLVDSGFTESFSLSAKSSKSSKAAGSGWAAIERESYSTPIYYHSEYRASTLSLDQEYRGILTGSLVYLDDPAGKAVLEVAGIETISRSAFALSGKSSILTADASKLTPFRETVRSLTVLVGSIELILVEELDPTPLEGNTVRFPSSLPALPEGRRVSVEGTLVASDENFSKLLTVKSCVASATEDAWIVTFEELLDAPIARDSARFRGNLVQATHGRSCVETLGHGDGRQKWAEFTLAHHPLTYLASATHPRGIASTLAVSVEGVLWQAVEDFYGKGPEDAVYTVRSDDDGVSRVRFGDGVTGRRLPTGVNNVKGVYRADLGAAGNLDPGSIRMLMTRPLGVQEVHQPLPATGGEDPEVRDDARQNAPLPIKALDRLVSLSDYADFARAYAGIAKAASAWGRFGLQQGILLTIAGVDGAEVADDSDLGVKFRESIQRFRDPTVPFEIINHEPLPFAIAAKLHYDERYEPESLQAIAEERLLARFSFATMQLGEAVTSSTVITLLQTIPGITGVDLDHLHLSSALASRESRLPARSGHIDRHGTRFPAQLLTLDADRVALTLVPAGPANS